MLTSARPWTELRMKTRAMLVANPGIRSSVLSTNSIASVHKSENGLRGGKQRGGQSVGREHLNYFGGST